MIIFRCIKQKKKKAKNVAFRLSRKKFKVSEKQKNFIPVIRDLCFLM